MKEEKEGSGKRKVKEREEKDEMKDIQNTSE